MVEPALILLSPAAPDILSIAAFVRPCTSAFGTIQETKAFMSHRREGFFYFSS